MERQAAGQLVPAAQPGATLLELLMVSNCASAALRTSIRGGHNDKWTHDQGGAPDPLIRTLDDHPLVNASLFDDAGHVTCLRAAFVHDRLIISSGKLIGWYLHLLAEVAAGLFCDFFNIICNE